MTHVFYLSSYIVLKYGILTRKKEEKPELSDNLKHFDEYKYLGLWYNNKGNLATHIKYTNAKVEAAIQTTFLIARNQNFKGIEIEVIWTLFEVVVVVYCIKLNQINEKNGLIQTNQKNIYKYIINSIWFWYVCEWKK